VPRSVKVRKDAQVDALVEETSAARFVYLKTRLLLHAENKTGEPCPCCTSTNAVQVEDRPDLELVIDRMKKRRWLRHEVEDVASFDALANSTRTLRLDAPIRCFANQLGPILDMDPLVYMLTGGPRSGKSSGAMAAFFRRWVLRGGNQSLGFLMAPKMPKTRLLLRKFLLGEKSDHFTPPICPLHEGKPALAKANNTMNAANFGIVLTTPP